VPEDIIVDMYAADDVLPLASDLALVPEAQVGPSCLRRRDINKPTLFLRFQVTADLAGEHQHMAAAL
jgi:hypothetical protein